MKRDYSKQKRAFVESGGILRQIDGVTYNSTKQIFGIAKQRGFTGTYEALCGRLQHGADTWEALCAPLKESSSRNAKARNAKSKAEIAAAIAAVDARKRQLTKHQETD
jgi:hypothetical protein